jgi:hypothetical protein
LIIWSCHLFPLLALWTALSSSDDVECHVGDHFLLAANHTPAAQFHKNFACIHAIIATGLFGVPQQGAIDTNTT